MGANTDVAAARVGRSDHDCKCTCTGCRSGNHCHNLAAGCKAQYW